MHTRFLCAFCAVILFLGLISTAGANSLASRLDGLAYYDDTLNIIWLADANLAASKTFGVDGINFDGSMNWVTANKWIAAMNAAGYLGYSDWRLPTMVDTGTPGCNRAFGGNSTDCGYNVQTSDGTMVYSEMASLWYDTLGNQAGNSQPGGGLTNTGPFGATLQPNPYWFGLTFMPDSWLANSAWVFNAESGWQGASFKNSNWYAWAVRSGDVSVVPLPAAVWLFGTGLIGLFGMVRFRKR